MMKNMNRLRLIAIGFVPGAILLGCAALRKSAQAPCPPHALASIDARFAAEAIATCKAEGADADTCRALPAIRAKYARERQAWVECKGEEP